MNTDKEVGLAIQKAGKELQAIIRASQGKKDLKVKVWEWMNYDKYMLPHINNLCKDYDYIKKRLDNQE